MLVGRREERAALEALLAAAREGRSGVLVLHGEAGVGKSALLDDAAASACGFRVARATGVQSERELAFGALHQLCAPLRDRLDGLPPPQRDALGAAFGLSAGTAPERFLVGLATLSLLSATAEEGPLLCVVEDAHLLDRPSAQALAFVARRLLAEPVALLFATRRRTEELAGLPELAVEGLRNADARTLLAGATVTPLDVRVSDCIVAETRGNPLALLELPRGFTPAELAVGFGVPVTASPSGTIEESFARRAGQLPVDAQRLLLVAAADQLGDADKVWRAAALLGVSRDAATPAAEAGLLDLETAVRFRHPLVRSAVYRSAALDERRRVHRALAEATDAEHDPDRRAWHRAAASSGPDEEVAAELERSAGRARVRSGRAATAVFLERSAALRLFDDDPLYVGSIGLADVVEATARSDAPDAARAALERLRERALASGTPWALGLLARAGALLADDQDAETLYMEAIEQLDRAGVVTDLARAHLLHGEWLRRRRRRRDARRELRLAYDLLERAGALAFAQRAETELLAAGGHARARAPEMRDELTTQEDRIARLAADGASNAEIAAKLSISPHTVAYHLRKVFTKLGVSARRELDGALSRASLGHATARRAGRAGATRAAASMNAPRAGSGSASRHSTANSTDREGASGRATTPAPAPPADVASATAVPSATSANSAGPGPPRRSSGAAPSSLSVAATASSYAVPSRWRVTTTASPSSSCAATGPVSRARLWPAPASTSHGTLPMPVACSSPVRAGAGARTACRRPSRRSRSRAPA